MVNPRSLLTKTIVIIWALQVLNLSVYGSAYMESYKDTSGKVHTELNQIDSLAEYITETVLEYHNAFPENGQHTKNTAKTLKGSFQLFHLEQKIKPVIITIPYNRNKHIIPQESYNFLFCKEINPPPPKFS